MGMVRGLRLDSLDANSTRSREQNKNISGAVAREKLSATLGAKNTVVYVAYKQIKYTEISASAKFGSRLDEVKTMLVETDLPLVGRGSSKWNGAADAGFTIVPDALLAKQGDLKLTATELVVLLQLVSFWWATDRPPFPPTNVLARRMGVKVRTVQRALGRLQKLGLVAREKLTTDDGKTVRAWNLDGLAARLNKEIGQDPTLQRRALLRRKAPPVLAPSGGFLTENRV